MTYDSVPLKKSNRKAAARLLVESFRDHWPDAWPTLEDALEEVDECLEIGPTRAAIGADGGLLGWIGIRPMYSRVWELHPLAVAETARRRGIGRALVEVAERLAADRGALTLQLGSDDEDDMTSLAGVDLYPNPLEHLSRITNKRDHPFGFYVRCGFAVTGVVPDANGFGKPDILMCKRVGRT